MTSYNSIVSSSFCCPRLFEDLIPILSRTLESQIGIFSSIDASILLAKDASTYPVPSYSSFIIYLYEKFFFFFH